MRKTRLHTKFIVLLASVSLVPLVVVSGVTLLRFQSSLQTEASKLGYQLATSAAGEIRTFMATQFGTLDNIATIYHPDFPIERDIAEQLVEVMLLRSENFMDISVTDAIGKEVARQNRLLVITNKDLRDLATSTAFLSVKERGVYVGPVYVRSGRPFFDLGRKISDSQGAFAGAVFAQVDARVMPSVVAEISKIVEKPGRVYIVNEKGTVIAHPDLSYVLAERDLGALPLVRNIVEHPDVRDVTATYENEEGNRVLGSAHSLTIQLFDARAEESSSVNWFVIAEQPEAAVYGDARSAALFSVALSVAAVIAAVIAAIFFAGRVARPIEALHRATLEFGKGNLSYRAEVLSHDEIGDLAQSFNTTAGALASTVASLKEAQRVTDAERNKLSLVLAGVTNAVIAVDLSTRIILSNKAAEELLGRTSQELLGKLVGEVVQLSDGERMISVETYCPLDDKKVEGPVFDRRDLRMKDAKGNEHFVNVVAGRIKEGERIGLGCILTFQDITREYIMDRTKREFVSIAAHQLRTPLTGMSWTVESLLSEAKGKLNEAQKELVGLGLDAIHRMIDLVNDLLDVSRIEEGKFGIKAKRLSIEPLLSHALAHLRGQAEKKGVKISCEVAKDLPLLTLDADKIDFVLNNIIDNAIKYTPQGGSVTARAYLEGNAVVVAVADTGIGIPASEQGRVFTKFFRSEKALLFHTDGSGLGLYVAKNIVEQHGGTIQFESKENQGTTFFISIPATRA